jgi:chromate transport protein ChrA
MLLMLCKLWVELTLGMLGGGGGVLPLLEWEMVRE